MSPLLCGFAKESVSTRRVFLRIDRDAQRFVKDCHHGIGRWFQGTEIALGG